VTDLDARLTAALQADTPPGRDPLFRIEVLQRRERARFRRQLLLAILAPNLVSGFSRSVRMMLHSLRTSAR
jgi:hypothetical protein